MLFSYQYIMHGMEKMQEYMDYIFYEVWYKAIYTQAYGMHLFDQKPELKEILIDFDIQTSEGGDLFLRSIEDIYYLFLKLDSIQTMQLKTWYEANNNIEALCCNLDGINPITYDELALFHQTLHDKIKKLFKNLYGDKIIGRAPITKKIGHIDDHYDAFMRVNTKGVCPCCGIYPLKGIYHTKREAYDHYLPKGTYPFNSINFKNLIPICHECNSSYKLENNPLYYVPNPIQNRRKAFYLYTNDKIEIKVSVTLNLTRKDEIKPENIVVLLEADGYEEQLETWKEIFSIEERYKALCSSENDGIDWLEQITDDIGNYEGDITKEQVLETLRKATKRKPFAEKRFLKLPFLESCENIGLLGDSSSKIPRKSKRFIQ